MSMLESDKLREFLIDHVEKAKQHIKINMKQKAISIIQQNSKELSKFPLSSEETSSSFKVGIQIPGEDYTEVTKAEHDDGAFRKAFDVLNTKDEILKLLN